MEQGFRVGEWLVQPDVGTLTRGEERVQLEPKVMEVLVYLARHAGELLPKEKIIRAVWAEAFVTDEVLTNAISELRKAFGDDAREPTFIQTLPRRGYQFIPPVSWAEAGSQVPSEQPPRPFWRHPVTLAIGGGLLVVLALLLVRELIPEAPEGPINSIAILPLENESEDPDTDYLSEGIADNIAFKLAPIGELRVFPPDQLERYRGRSEEIQTVARELDVEAVLSANLRVLGDTLALRVRLHDADGNLLWGQPYNQRVSDVLLIQTAIAERVVEELRLQLTGEERERLARRPTDDAEAYDLYLRGCAVMYTNPKALAYLELALERDPSFALARVRLADCYMSMGDLESALEHHRRARIEAEKALIIDPDLAEAHWIKGLVLAYDDRDWRGAEQELDLYRKTRHAEPSYEWHWLYTSFFLWLGKSDEAVAAAERIKEYDPAAVPNPHMYRWARRYQRAIEAANTRRTGDFTYLLTLCYEQVGLADEAFKWFLEFDGNTEQKRLEYQKAYAESGMPAVWRLFIGNLKGVEIETREHYGYGRLFDLAATYAHLGEKEGAFEWLGKLAERPLAHPFVVDPRLR